MNSQHTINPIILLFPVVYIIALYSALLLGDGMLAMSFEESFAKLPVAAKKLKLLVYMYPLASVPLSMASLQVLGQQASRPGSRAGLFGKGLAAGVMGNLMAFQGGKFLVGWPIATEWANSLGSSRLNTLTTFVAPLLACIVAFVVIFLLFRIKAWIKPEF